MVSHVPLFATPWTVACQAPLSMGIPRQEHWSGLPFPPLRDLPSLRIQHVSPALQADSLLQSHQKSSNPFISPAQRSRGREVKWPAEGTPWAGRRIQQGSWLSEKHSTPLSQDSAGYVSAHELRTDFTFSNDLKNPQFLNDPKKISWHVVKYTKFKFQCLYSNFYRITAIPIHSVSSIPTFFFFFFFKFLATPHSMWDLGSLTRDWTCAPLWKEKSSPLDHQSSPIHSHSCTTPAEMSSCHRDHTAKDT